MWPSGSRLFTRSMQGLWTQQGRGVRLLRRGFCPSCVGRRMADTAAFCVDHLFPKVPARQYVLSLPYALRFKMAYSPDATTIVLSAFIRSIRRRSPLFSVLHRPSKRCPIENLTSTRTYAPELSLYPVHKIL